MVRHKRNIHGSNEVCKKRRKVPSQEVNARNLTTEDIQSDPLKFGKSVNGGRGIKCKLCRAVLKVTSRKAGGTKNHLRRHLGNKWFIRIPVNYMLSFS